MFLSILLNERATDVSKLTSKFTVDNVPKKVKSNHGALENMFSPTSLFLRIICIESYKCIIQMPEHIFINLFLAF